MFIDVIRVADAFDVMIVVVFYGEHLRRNALLLYDFYGGGFDGATLLLGATGDGGVSIFHVVIQDLQALNFRLHFMALFHCV